MEYDVAVPFIDHLGFALEVYEGGKSQISYAPLPAHLNAFGVTHGGALMTLLDVAMAAAARSVQKDMGLVTIEMKTSFMHPARGKVTAKGMLMHRSTSLAFVEATVFDKAGQACAHAIGTFKYMNTLAAGKSVKAPISCGTD